MRQTHDQKLNENGQKEKIEKKNSKQNPEFGAKRTGILWRGT